MKNVKALILVSLVLSSCKQMPFHFGHGSGGDGYDGGPVPTAEDMDNYINRVTNPENKTCEDVRTDVLISKKFPVVYPSGKMPWKNEYSQAVSEQFDKPYMKQLQEQKIDEGDLSLIKCPGYNYATPEEKKKFWILFVSAVSKPESNFNAHETYSETNGTISTGLMQIDQRASKTWCGNLQAEDKRKFHIDFLDMMNPIHNLQCGLSLLQSQVTGAPAPYDGFDPGDGHVYRKGQLTRQSLVGRLFTDNGYFYWSTLSNKNASGKREVIDWFSVHAQRQLKFCNRKNPIDGYTPELDSQYKPMSCDKVLDDQEKENCKTYLLNAKYDADQTNPIFGENPVDKTCKRIDNTSRKNPKDQSNKSTSNTNDEATSDSKAK